MPLPSAAREAHAVEPRTWARAIGPTHAKLSSARAAPPPSEARSSTLLPPPSIHAADGTVREPRHGCSSGSRQPSIPACSTASAHERWQHRLASAAAAAYLSPACLLRSASPSAHLASRQARTASSAPERTTRRALPSWPASSAIATIAHCCSARLSPLFAPSVAPPAAPPAAPGTRPRHSRLATPALTNAFAADASAASTAIMKTSRLRRPPRPLASASLLRSLKRVCSCFDGDSAPSAVPCSLLCARNRQCSSRCRVASTESVGVGGARPDSVERPSFVRARSGGSVRACCSRLTRWRGAGVDLVRVAVCLHVALLGDASMPEAMPGANGRGTLNVRSWGAPKDSAITYKGVNCGRSMCAYRVRGGGGCCGG